MNNTPTLQDLRNFALQQAQKDRVTRACAYCDKSISMRPDQVYCSAKCRKAAHDLKRNAELILLRNRVGELELEVASLRKQLENNHEKT